MTMWLKYTGFRETPIKGIDRHTSLDLDPRVVTTKPDAIIVKWSNNVVKDFILKLNVLLLAYIHMSVYQQ